jgi:hypothetical protein
MNSFLARIYTRSSNTQLPSSFVSPLTHLNIDLQGSGVNIALLDSQLLSHLPRLQSLVYQSYGKSNEDADDLIRLSKKLRRILFIRKGLSPDTDLTQCEFKNSLIAAVQEITYNKNSRRSLTLHTSSYPDKILYLPFIQWNKSHTSSHHGKKVLDEGNCKYHLEEIKKLFYSMYS